MLFGKYALVVWTSVMTSTKTSSQKSRLFQVKWIGSLSHLQITWSSCLSHLQVTWSSCLSHLQVTWSSCKGIHKRGRVCPVPPYSLGINLHGCQCWTTCKGAAVRRGAPRLGPLPKIPSHVWVQGTTAAIGQEVILLTVDITAGITRETFLTKKTANDCHSW